MPVIRRAGLPAPIAGLPGNKAWVKVAPPLFFSGPSLGLVFEKSPVAARPQVPSLSML